MKTKRLRVTVLVDQAEILENDPNFEVSPDEPTTEYHVIQSLRYMGHKVSILGAGDDIMMMARGLEEQKPEIVFNLTEQFACNRQLDKNIAAFLEMMSIPFTGSGLAGLMLCRDKGLCKQLLSHHKIRVPGFVSLPLGKTVRVSKNLNYPLVVKPALEDGSEGISNASIVYSEESLRQRVDFVHDSFSQPAIAEEYIGGRELYVSILGNKRLKVLPARECFFDSTAEEGPRLLTYRVKWNKQYRSKWGISFGYAELEPEVFENIAGICKRVYRIMQMRDYGRIDLRLTPDNKVVILEANPNPDIAYGEEVAEAAEKTGISYEQLLEDILWYALRRYK